VVQKYSNNKIKNVECEELKTKWYKCFINGGDYNLVRFEVSKRVYTDPIRSLSVDMMDEI
jgi:hypothetical protein